MAPPADTRLTAFWTVASGAVGVPALPSLPFVATYSVVAAAWADVGTSAIAPASATTPSAIRGTCPIRSSSRQRNALSPGWGRYARQGHASMSRPRHGAAGGVTSSGHMWMWWRGGRARRVVGGAAEADALGPPGAAAPNVASVTTP